MQNSTLQYIGVVPNGYLLTTSMCTYIVKFDGSDVDTNVSEIIDSIPIDNSLLGAEILSLNEVYRKVVVTTNKGIARFIYKDNMCKLEVNEELIHSFKFKSDIELYFDLYPRPYHKVTISGINRPIRLNKVYKHLCYDGTIYSEDPFQLQFIVNKEHLDASIQALKRQFDVNVVRIEDFILE